MLANEKRKKELDSLLEKYQVQPVGIGYIDCITTKENITGFVNAISSLGIRITDITWWCHNTTDEDRGTGCPHGGGGPQSKYFDGWFSEMYQYKNVEIKDNDEVLPYIFEKWPKDEKFLPCLEPALWLDVPEDWANRDAKTDAIILPITDRIEKQRIPDDSFPGSSTWRKYG
jgi:hypothetical protein